MKNILKLLAVAVVFYLLFAFANAEINFIKWGEFIRYSFALLVIPVSYLGYILSKELED